MSSLLPNHILERVARAEILETSGRITRVTGTLIEGELPRTSIGAMWTTGTLELEVIGFRDGITLMMPFGSARGVAPGQPLRIVKRAQSAHVGPAILGRVIDAMGNPIDDRGPVVTSDEVELFRKPPNPMHRQVINKQFTVGVRAIDATMSFGEGQRVGLMAGSGVGKSTLLGMVARGSSADVVVLALIGERGREVRHFLERELPKECLSRCVVVVATSDEPALTRMRGAYLATSIAEYFRDKGQNVLLLMDSITRFALANREVGLAAGEPPTTKGFTPSVFSTIPPLLERSGPGINGCGCITAIYTVLAEGEDMEDPIVDHVRSIVDGHIVLTRRLANKNHFPAIDVLASLSRVMTEVVDEGWQNQAARMRNDMALIRDAEDLIRLGAYTPGASAELDTALARAASIENFLKQARSDVAPLANTLASLREIYP